MKFMLALAAVIWAIQESPRQDQAIPESISAITPKMIQIDVDHLASDEYYGRYWLSPFARRAAVWIAGQMEAAGCEPLLPDDAWFQEVKTKDASPNVVGMIRGSDPEAGYLLVGAHYDHLPPRRRGKDTIYNGADDNASGVAGMLAVARSLAPLKDSLRASVVFIAFTGEEAGLKGSRHFAANAPVPLDSVRGLFNMDMISRGEEDLIFIDGAKQSPNLIRALKEANKAVGLRLEVDTHPDWLQRSDQWPFLRKNVEAVLFSVEDHEDYHQVSDHADRILAPLAAKVARLVALATLDLAGKKPVSTPEKGATEGSESVPSDAPAGAPGTRPAKDPE